MIRPHTWSIELDRENRIARTQIPLQLAWALTVHKAQGQSLDAVGVRLRSCFTTGQCVLIFPQIVFSPAKLISPQRCTERTSHSLALELWVDCMLMDSVSCLFLALTNVRRIFSVLTRQFHSLIAPDAVKGKRLLQYASFLRYSRKLTSRRFS
jgi:hypothetical protein